MDEKQVISALRDELGLAIEASVAAQTSPDLKARVRARVERERVTAVGWRRWQFAGAGVAIAIAAVIAMLPWHRASERPITVSAVAAVPMTIAAPLVAAAQPATPWLEHRDDLRDASDPQIARERRTQSAATNQAAALKAFIAHVRQRRLDSSALVAARPTGQALQVSTISIERIAIEPLPRLAAITGEQQ